MKNQYNLHEPKNYNEDYELNVRDLNAQHEMSSKLYSSESLGYAGSPKKASSKDNSVSATQLYSNLNNSLEGLLSKIQAIKDQHVVQQKNPKPHMMKKVNMDVSGFPMPNLMNNQFLKGKQYTGPILKPKQKNIHSQLNFKKDSSSLNEDKIAVSPPTQQTITHVQSVPTISHKEFDIKTATTQDKNLFEGQSHQNPVVASKEQKNVLGGNSNNSNYLKTGLLNIANTNMKVSMQVTSDQFDFKKGGGISQLQKIIQKQATQTNIMQKSIIFNEPVTLKDFQLGKLVGSGKFGDVHICRHRLSGTLFALKKIFKSTIKEYNMITQFTRQLKIHYRLNHPNIIKLYTHFQDQYHVFLIMQYAEGGILMDKLKCTEQQASRYIDQTIDAVQYLHKLKIAHRDIKPQNIVVQFGKVLKLCDFGWASYYENEMKTTFCGTLDYLSPQMKEGGQYDNSVDIWSVGVLTYQLLTGNPPYRKQLMLSMKNGIGPSKPGSRKVNWDVKYPPFVSPMAQSFIRNLLKQNPDERATLRFCLNHTFIKKYHEELQTIMLLYPDFERII